MSVGIDMIPKVADSARSASVSTFANTRSGCSSDADSKTGPNTRQGPHQDAQKSTKTVSFDDTTSSKLSAVRFTVGILKSSPWASPGSSTEIPCGYSRATGDAGG